MKIKHFLIMIAAVVFIMLEPVEAYCAEKDRVPDLTDQGKNLNIIFYVQKSGVDTFIEGAEIGINKIADLTVSGGSASYTVTEPYLSLQKLEDGREVTFEGISVSESVEFAKEFAELTGEAEKTSVTDSKGECKFSDLEQGIYLVRELSSTGEAEKYELFEPYMISVPYSDDFTGTTEWLYDVISEPKTVVKEKPEHSEHSEPQLSTISRVSEPSHSSMPSEPSKRTELSTPSQASVPSEVVQQESSTVLTGDSSIRMILLVCALIFSVVCVWNTIKRRRVTDDEQTK